MKKLPLITLSLLISGSVLAGPKMGLGETLLRLEVGGRTAEKASLLSFAKDKRQLLRELNLESRSLSFLEKYTYLGKGRGNTHLFVEVKPHTQKGPSLNFYIGQEISAAEGKQLKLAINDSAIDGLRKNISNEFEIAIKEASENEGQKVTEGMDYILPKKGINAPRIINQDGTSLLFWQFGVDPEVMTVPMMDELLWNLFH